MTKKREPADFERMIEENADYDFEPAYGGPFHPKLLPRDEMLSAWRPVIERAANDACSSVLRLRDLCQSPIEELFLAALWAGPSGWASFDQTAIESGGVVAAQRCDPTMHDHLYIHAQAPVGAYFADFMLTMQIKPGVLVKFPQGLSTRVAIELDGHDFHEKTRRQAAHDKKRDRYFTGESIPFLRFTGSEIHHNAEKCAADALEFLYKRLRKMWGQPE